MEITASATYLTPAQAETVIQWEARGCRARGDEHSASFLDTLAFLFRNLADRSNTVACFWDSTEPNLYLLDYEFEMSSRKYSREDQAALSIAYEKAKTLAQTYASRWDPKP